MISEKQITDWRKEFTESKDLQSEFGGQVEDYVAYKQAEARGAVGCISRGRVIKQSAQDISAVETSAKKEFAGSAALRAEFGGQLEDYIAYRKAEAQGRTGNVVRDKTVLSSSAEKANSQTKGNASEQRVSGGDSLRSTTVFGSDGVSIPEEKQEDDWQPERPGRVYSESRKCYVPAERTIIV